MDVFEFGPFKLDAIKGVKLRDASPNSFCLTEEGLFWKFHLSRTDSEGYLPLSGDQAFNEAGKSVGIKQAIQLCHDSADIRLSFTSPEAGQFMEGHCAPGAVIMSKDLGPCLSILVDRQPAYVDFAAGHIHWGPSDNIRQIWCRGWRLMLSHPGEHPITLAAYSLDA